MERFSYGVLIRRHRLNAQLTQSQLAIMVGESQSFISKVEAGEQRIDVDELKKICDALGLNILDFVREYFAS